MEPCIITEQELREYKGNVARVVSRRGAVTNILQYRDGIGGDDGGFFVGKYRLADMDLLLTDQDALVPGLWGRYFLVRLPYIISEP